MLTRIECDALRGVANCAFAPRCRAKPHKGFLRDVGASASRAVRSSPRPGRAWLDAMCSCGRVSYTTTRDDVRCHETLCNLLEINTTSRLFITEMVTRSALLVSSNLFPSHTKTLVGTRPVSQCHSDAGAWLVVVPSRRGHANIPHAVHNSKTSRS